MGDCKQRIWKKRDRKQRKAKRGQEIRIICDVANVLIVKVSMFTNLRPTSDAQAGKEVVPF